MQLALTLTVAFHGQHDAQQLLLLLLQDVDQQQ
jgi:hypothetical protein